VKSQYGTVIKPDSSHEVIRPGNGQKFTLEELQKAVGGFIELIHLPPGHKLGHHTAYVNEEGKLIPLAPNPKATEMYGRGDVIRGNLLIVRTEERK
jgi:hypothetical protein